jgi:hypothetical protein
MPYLRLSGFRDPQKNWFQSLTERRDFNKSFVLIDKSAREKLKSGIKTKTFLFLQKST